MRKTYTEAIHAERLITILETPDTCDLCPASERNNPNFSPDAMWLNDACIVCADFVDVPKDRIYKCPCHYFGGEGAFKRSWIALEEKGYI